MGDGIGHEQEDAVPTVVTDGEQRDRAWSWEGVVVVTLICAVLLGGVGVLVVGAVSISACPWNYDLSGGESESSWFCGNGWLLLALIPAAVCLVWGLAKAWRVGTGRSHVRPSWEPTHQVPAGGMKAFGRHNASSESVDLPEGLRLRLDATQGGWAIVTGSNGASGWVEARLLVPLPGAGSGHPGSRTAPSPGG